MHSATHQAISAVWRIESAKIVATVARTDAIVDCCFAETTTIGLRITRAQRRVLARTLVAPAHGGLVGAKVVTRRSERTAKAEMDEVAAKASDRAARERLRRTSESAALDRSREASHGTR